jgi:H2-forming N5,N10-methylenetetrahydromethanopterin dehydrogenase-like enzyme
MQLVQPGWYSFLVSILLFITGCMNQFSAEKVEAGSPNLMNDQSTYVLSVIMTLKQHGYLIHFYDGDGIEKKLEKELLDTSLLAATLNELQKDVHGKHQEIRIQLRIDKSATDKDRALVEDLLQSKKITYQRNGYQTY